VRFIVRCKEKGCHFTTTVDVPDDYRGTVEQDGATIIITRRYGRGLARLKPPCPVCGGGYGKLAEAKAVEATVAEHVRCDPRCTGARGPKCDCECGGANHGAAYSPNMPRML
jgi:hypothetical protein